MRNLNAWACFLLAAISAAAETPMHLLYAPALSPDGSNFVFEWENDIWQASSHTGEATPVIQTKGRDMFPKITPDGKRIVFTTDLNGFPQLASRAIGGGEIEFHSIHTEGSQLECLSPDGTKAIVRGMRDRSGHNPWRLMEVDLTRPSRESFLFDARAHSPSWSPDGNRILFCRGGELPYRRGFRGSRAARIWSYDRRDDSFACEIPGDFEARSPLWLPDGSGFIFVSNQSGTANLWIQSGPELPRQLTFHDDEEVLTPAISHDGSTLLYRHGFDLLRIDPSHPEIPHKLHLYHRQPPVDPLTQTVQIRGCVHTDYCIPTESMVFSEAGELWCTNPGNENPIRLTQSPPAEEQPVFLPNSDTLFCVSDNGIESSILRFRFTDNQLTHESTVHNCQSSISSLATSPCGSFISWIEGRGDLRIADQNGAHIRTVFPCWDKPTYCWSPDGRWLAVAAEDANANRDIYLVSATREAPPVNLTRHPAFDGSPAWSPDGRRLVFTSKRGAANEAALWCIDWHNRIGSQPDGKPNTSPPDVTRLRETADKARKLDTRGIEPRRVIWSGNPEVLLFQSRTPSNKKIYQYDFSDDRTTTHATSNGIPVRPLADGSTLFRRNRVPSRWTADGFVDCPVRTSFNRNREDFLRLGFRRIWRTLGERFHDPAMNGRDWAAIRRKYESHAAHARTSREFDHIIGRLMGELNASHMVFQRRAWPGEPEPKSPKSTVFHPGLRFAPPKDGPLTITGVLAGSPVSKLDDPPVTGDIVTRIGGRIVDGTSPVDSYFRGIKAPRVPLTLRRQDGTDHTISVECIPYEKARKLDAMASRARAAERCATAAGIAYIHLPDMSRHSLETFRLAIHRADSEANSLIIDLRGNGGGREANRMLAILRQEIPFTTKPRSGPAGYPNDRLPDVPWTKPVAVLCDENTYSNAEIFCHAYLAAQRGPLVGTKTAGGVISAVMTSIPDLGKLQIPFRTWSIPHTHASLDLNGAMPTHPVPWTPANEHRSEDPQLETAIRLLSPP